MPCTIDAARRSLQVSHSHSPTIYHLCPLKMRTGRLTQSCNGMTQKDAPCKRLVSREDIILYPKAELVPLYCRDHLNSNLVEQRFRCLRYPDRFIEYDSES